MPPPSPPQKSKLTKAKLSGRSSYALFQSLAGCSSEPEANAGPRTWRKPAARWESPSLSSSSSLGFPRTSAKCSKRKLQSSSQAYFSDSAAFFLDTASAERSVSTSAAAVPYRSKPAFRTAPLPSRSSSCLSPKRHAAPFFGRRFSTRSSSSSARRSLRISSANTLASNGSLTKTTSLRTNYSPESG